MKKQLSILFGAILAAGLSGAALAGAPPAYPCGTETCENGVEISVKCNGNVAGTVAVGYGQFDMFFCVDNDWSHDCDPENTSDDYLCDIGGWLDADKTEVKCQNAGKKKLEGIAVEFEAKYAECDEG